MVEAVQRWRIAFRRGTPALDLGPPEIARAWEAGLVSAGIPIMMSATATPRPRLTFAAPLPAGRIAEHDLADFVLSERWPLPRLRPVLVAALPPGFELVDLYDVWLGSPAITAALSAIGSRVTVAGTGPAQLGAAVSTVLASERLERTRPKAGGSVAYDLRPLILGLETATQAPADSPTRESEQAIVRMILKSSPDGPSGRPDEVILALGEAAGHELIQVELVRERLWTADELPTLHPG
ncbi:MAG: TIGR03936 family radical SAM-associated protein [Candidatus Limnocylindrales bacterium]